MINILSLLIWLFFHNRTVVIILMIIWLWIVSAPRCCEIIISWTHRIGTSAFLHHPFRRLLPHSFNSCLYCVFRMIFKWFTENIFFFELLSTWFIEQIHCFLGPLKSWVMIWSTIIIIKRNWRSMHSTDCSLFVFEVFVLLLLYFVHVLPVFFCQLIFI